MTGFSPATSRRPSVPSAFVRLRRAMGRGVARITSGAIAPYQTAVLRIGLAFAWFAFLLREWLHRADLYGVDAPWSWGMGRELISVNHAFTALMWNDGRLWFEVVYAAAMVVSVMLLLGWRTRTTSLLFMIGVLAIVNRNPMVADGGDNVFKVMAIYLVFTRCGQVWSLDARRAAAGRDGGRDVAGIVMWVFLTGVLALVTGAGKLSPGWALLLWAFVLGQAAWWLVRRFAAGEPRTVMTMAANAVHAGALLVIAVEVCLIYATAGWYKIQGTAWQNGTALYYPLHVGAFTPWPALSHAIASSSLVILIFTYGTVMAEVAFPFTLFNTRARTVMVAIMISLHVGIGVVLGLTFFALVMIAADAFFLPTAVLRWVGDRVARAVPRTRVMATTAAMAAGVGVAAGARSRAEASPKPERVTK
ncbi:HTTM domain-containing protein [Streptomyces sp. NPDC058691]|uniref:HTTM domain-containing protein n=1 Tax=Streptomyces sp. NPDC058691 TaxID=3346601 RepID=UPI00365923E1